MTETCDIHFGKLKIVMNSTNSVPDATAFFEKVAITTRPIPIQQSQQSQSQSQSSFMVSQTELANEHMKKASKPCHKKTRRCCTETDNNSLNYCYCWWCRETKIEMDSACFVPMKYNELTKKYAGSGYFCSWECAKAFNFDMNDAKVAFRGYLIHDLCKKLYGIEKSRKIKYAPHWTEMNRYGGTIPDQHFLNFSRTTFDKKRKEFIS
jgi:hypothetical protein